MKGKAMSKRHPTEQELKERLAHFPRSDNLTPIVTKRWYAEHPRTERPTREQVQEIVVQLSKEYLESLRLTHDARGKCLQTGCFFNPETHRRENP
jgi:hypothetical protein